MSKNLVTSKGAPVQIGVELGKGGEGSVFEVPQMGEVVAKLYHKPPDQKKQAKLSFMAAGSDPQLLQYAAWPQDTLHAKPGGPVLGFLMAKVVDREPIHMLYGPAHRRQQYPRASWEFLLFAARNTAAAFEALHAHGHVLADVNQGNVMVGADTKVTLIDCDSFQVDTGGALHLCEVGVSHFTPPELQGLPSFDGVKRTVNHDNFGLALLIFHLLFGARHPYAGVPLRKDVGESLEGDIKTFRYAYARDSLARGSKPPPASIPLGTVPDAMVAMFEAAFTERGARGGRPTAQNWVLALDAFRKQLKRCSASPVMHVYGSHLTQCPWCALDNQGNVYFVDVHLSLAATASGFVLAKVLALIEAVPPPAPVPVIRPTNAGLKASPLPAGVGNGGESILVRLVIVASGIGLGMAFPKAVLLIVIGTLLSFWKAGSIGGESRKAEKERRKLAMEAAERAYNVLETRMRKEAGPEGFAEKKRSLTALKVEYGGLAAAEANEIEHLKSTAEVRQRQKFLERWFIDSATIKGVGQSNKAALRSFGIETAADVSWNKVIAVKGFGEVKTRAVVDWRQACERKFSFNPAAAVSDADRNAVRAKVATRKRVIEAALGSGAGELQNFRQEAARKSNLLVPQVTEAANLLAQAQMDFNAM